MKATIVIEVGELFTGTPSKLTRLDDGSFHLQISNALIDDPKASSHVLQHLLVVAADVVERSRPLPPRIDGDPSPDTAKQHR